MNLFWAILLGIVQGLTEFIPVSSTAHLRIVPALFNGPDPGAAFTAVIQIGTLVAALVYFRRDVAHILSAWFAETFRGQFARSHDARMGWLIILGTLPIAVAGKSLKKHIEGPWRSLYVIAAAMIGVALLLALAEQLVARWQRSGKKLRDMEQLSWWDSLTIGVAQAFALVPGASRSGVTIGAGLFRGLTRESAARFSFLLSLPAVFAAAVLELYENRVELIGSHDKALDIVVCTIVSGIVGYATIAWLLSYLKRRTLYVFIVYRVALGLLLIGLVWRGVLKQYAGAEEDPATPTAAQSTTGHPATGLPAPGASAAGQR